MKKEKCGHFNIILCAMAVSALGLLAVSVLLAAAAKKHCKDNLNCSAGSRAQNTV